MAADLGAQTKLGRYGLSCESILRRAVLEHLRGETWRGLAFALEDSRSACRFARVEPLAPPKKSALQAARAKLYRELLRIAVDTLGDLDAARPAVTESGAPWSAKWLACADHYAGLLKAVAVQSVRRVLLEEKVPAGEKIAGLFEPHTDIIRKGGRATAYGHKINLATGRSGLVLDVVVESGNPADSARCLPMLERHRAHCGGPPTHAAFDGGYASRANLEGAKAMGVAHAVFSKRRGLKEEDMTPSPWIFDRLRRFRAGVEAGISWLKRCFGLGRCRWCESRGCGLDNFPKSGKRRIPIPEIPAGGRARPRHGRVGQITPKIHKPKPDQGITASPTARHQQWAGIGE